MEKTITVIDRPLALVAVNFHQLTDVEVYAAIIALRRQFVEISAKIDNVQGERPTIADKIALVNERRALFNLIEQFDNVQPPLTELIWDQECRVSVNTRQLPDADIKRLHHALVWFRDNWVGDHEPLSTPTKNVIRYLEDTVKVLKIGVPTDEEIAHRMDVAFQSSPAQVLEDFERTVTNNSKINNKE